MGVRAGPGGQEIGITGEPPRPLVVVDACTLIILAKAGIFELLWTYFVPLVPSSVRHEVVVKGAGRPGSAEVERALTDGLLIEVSSRQMNAERARLPQHLHAGEKDAILICLHRSLPFLSDDGHALVAAERLGIQVIRNVDLLVLARKDGHIPSLRAVLEGLRAKGWALKEPLERELLIVSGEER